MEEVNSLEDSFRKSMIILLLIIPLIDMQTASSYALQYSVNEPPVWLTEVRLYGVNNDTDMFVDIYYNYSFDSLERIKEEKLYLSLDNDTFILSIHRNYDPELMPSNGTSGFFFANSVGDPLPFDVQEGQILYGYVEVITTDSTYRTKTFSEEIPITVIRSFLFRIPSWFFFWGGIIASIVPIILCIYLVMRKSRKP